MTEQPLGPESLSDYVTRRFEEPTHCDRCKAAFDLTDFSFDGRARYKNTPFCNGCASNCHDSTDAFHICRVCRDL